MTLVARKYPKKHMDVEIIAYSKNVPFHNICSVCEHILDSNDELTPLDHTSVSGQVAPVPGYKAIYRLIGDGSHTPTFNEAFKKKDGTGDFVISNNIGGDPLFSTGFILNAGSPAIDAGVDVGLPYFGKAPDLGAYEFTDSSIATTGLGWENHYAKKNFKDDVNFEKGFSVKGVPINFTTNVTYLLRLSPTASPPVSPTEGTIYMDTDHHLYLYNGSAWVQLDN